MTIEKSAKNLTTIHAVVVLMIMIIIGNLPATAPITPLGMKILGVFAGMIYGWSTIGLIFPSLLGLTMFAVVGGTPIAQIFMDGFGNNVTILILFMFIFAAAITEAGIGEFIALWLVTRKVMLGRPWLLTTVFLLAAFVISATVNSFGAIIICWGILYGVCQKIGYNSGDKWPTFMVFAIIVSAILGSGAFAFRTIPMLVIGVYEKIIGEVINFLSYSAVFWALSFVILAGVMVLGRFVYKIDVSLLKNVTAETFDKTGLALSKSQKTHFAFLILLIVLLMSSSILPKSWGLAVVLNKLGPAGITLAVVMIMLCIQLDGKPLVDFQKIARQGVLWDPIILTVVALPVCNAMLADDAGIKAWLMEALGPVFLGRSVFIFAFLAFGLAMLLTNFVNNGMTAVIFLLIVVSFAGSLGANPTAMAVLLIFTVHIAIVTPAACPMAGLMFSNVEWITPKEIYRYALPTLVWTLLVILVLGLPLANLVF